MNEDKIWNQSIILGPEHGVTYSVEKEESTYKVPVTTIREIKEHPNAERLELAFCYGFQIAISKGKYKKGDSVLFIPPQSILPSWLEERLFPVGSKITLNKSRVKQIRIRGAVSEGMIVDISDIIDHLPDGWWVEGDFAQVLGIKKYQPPSASYQSNLPAVRKERNRKLENPYFHKYGGLDNFKYYPDLFIEGEEISVTEKLHGTNCRFGYVPFAANTTWKKILKFLRLAPKWEFVFGSNNVQLQEKPGHKTFYDENVYEKMVTQYNLHKRLKPGEVIYGEIIGDKIQKDYNYGCGPEEHKLVLFDLKIQTETSSEYVNVDEFQNWCKERRFEHCPELYRGPYNAELVKNLTLGDSVYCSSQKVREGVVIKPLVETACYMGRKVLKLISEIYLDSNQSEFH